MTSQGAGPQEPVPEGPVPESAVLVLVPEAEAVLGDLRTRLDRVGGTRVPAHVTVVYPFVPPDRIDAAVEAALARAIASVEAFDASFERVEWFGDGVLFLAPDPDAGFRQLTAAVAAAFPEHPPYGGAWADPVPHLTVGAGSPVEQLTAAVPDLRAALPLRSRVTHAVLMTGTGDTPWHPHSHYLLHPTPAP